MSHEGRGEATPLQKDLLWSCERAGTYRVDHLGPHSKLAVIQGGVFDISGFTFGRCLNRRAPPDRFSPHRGLHGRETLTYSFHPYRKKKKSRDPETPGLSIMKFNIEYVELSFCPSLHSLLTTWQWSSGSFPISKDIPRWVHIQSPVTNTEEGSWLGIEQYAYAFFGS